MKKTKTTWLDSPAEKIELEGNEVMCIFWEKLSKEHKECIAYAHPIDDILIVYYKRGHISHIHINGLMLFKVNYVIEERIREV